jgi:hypothetical protein
MFRRSCFPMRKPKMRMTRRKMPKKINKMIH